MSQTRLQKLREDPIFRKQLLALAVKMAASRKGKHYTGKRLVQQQVNVAKAQVAHHRLWIEDLVFRNRELARLARGRETQRCNRLLGKRVSENPNKISS
jgi:hypothetical protein